MTMVLLDTNVLLWFFAGDQRLSQSTRQSIEGDPTNFVVSVVSFWEIAIKKQIGKLSIDFDVPKAIDDSGFTTLDISTQHVYAYEMLPLIHRDPFDRMLIAQSKIEKLSLLTGDSKIQEYEIKTIDALK